MADLVPDAIVLVATTKALKYNGGVPKDKVTEPNLEALEKGICNLHRHMNNLLSYEVPVVVCINKFHTDIEEELEYIRKNCSIPCIMCSSFAEGGKGAQALAEEVLFWADMPNLYDHLTRPYNYEDDIKTKVRDLAKNIYHADYVNFSDEALEKILNIEAMGYGKTPICIAKTQYSFSDDATLLGAPKGYTLQVQDVRLSAGAGFVVLICGKIMTMPGLPKIPAANNITVDNDGRMVGIF
jgi:formate--tetrahydrofolate ligase